MASVAIFDKGRDNLFLPYICDDIFYGVIVPELKRHYCNKCLIWFDSKRISAYYFPKETLCFYCRHKSRWPKC